MIRVLIAENSPVARELIDHILSSDTDIQVIGTAVNGREAVESTAHNKPDLVTMDIHMPELNGFEATRVIMETNPVPIIIVTGSSDMREMETSFRALEAGALVVLQKPQGIGHADYEVRARDLITTVKLMAEVKVVKRWARHAGRASFEGAESLAGLSAHPTEIKIVAVGASTGGPPVIEKILSRLPKDFPAPVLIVQHMAAGFTQGFAEWLGQTSSLPVHVALNGSLMLPGHVYVAPDGSQMKVQRDGRVSCVKDKSENGLMPSVSCLFQSVAEVFGKKAAAVLLTGMGKDGAEELRQLREQGAVTMAQDKESSVVFGMPGEAIRLNAAQYVLSPEKIAAVLTNLVDKKNEVIQKPSISRSRSSYEQ